MIYSYKIARDAGLSDEMSLKYMKYYEKKTYVKQYGKVAFSDSERSRCYKAEWQFEQQIDNPKFSSYDEARAFVKRIIKSECWKRMSVEHGMYQPVQVSIIEKRKVSNARTAGRCFGNEIQLDPIYGLNVYVILHEMAHAVGNMHHGVRFRIDLCKLVSRFMGQKQSKILKESFRKQGLKMNKPQEPKTPEKWLEGYMKTFNMRNANATINLDE